MFIHSSTNQELYESTSVIKVATTYEKYNSAAHLSYRLKLNYPLPSLLAMSISLQYESIAV